MTKRTAKVRAYKYTCDTDPRSWVKVNKKFWTRRDLNAFVGVMEASREHLEAEAEGKSPLREYYESFIVEICIVDVDGNEYTDLDALFSDDMDNLDASVFAFFSGLPTAIYQARSNLGNATSVN